MSGVIARATRCLLALGLCAAGAGCGGTSGAGAVTIVIPWATGTPEYDAFTTVIGPWKQQHTGVQVVLEVSRAPAQQLDIDLAAGDPPDLVDLPSPVAVDQYAEKRTLMPLSGIDLSSYAQPWRSLAELGTKTVYLVPVKADVKSLIWYYMRALRSPPTSWAELRTISTSGTPWCLGLASGPATGWPGADWIADILLSSNAVRTYENWLGGGLPWKSAQVKNAWDTWGTLMGHGAAIDGGPLGALKTSFSAGSEMASGRCELEHGALSATGLTSTNGYNYLPLPSISGAAASPIMVSGDFMGLFTDNPNAKSLLEYLALTTTQTQWVKQGGYAFSADQQVTPADYPNGVHGVQYQIARHFLAAHDSTTLCFSAEDMMQPNMTTAFEQAVLHYVSDRTSLEALLNGLQMTQHGAGASPPALANLACSTP